MSHCQCTKSTIKGILLVFLLLAIIPSTYAIQLRNGHPATYTVKEGDTLWAISGRFLKKPWQWQKIWHNNPDIKNPDEIYPGDVLALAYHNGKPYLRMQQRGDVRLSPNIESKPKPQQIPAIPLNVIRPFFDTSLVLTDDDFEHAPYIVGFQKERIVGSTGTHFFASGIVGKEKLYSVYQKSKPFLDPETRQFLGIGAINVGHAEVLFFSDPAALVLTDSNKVVNVGDFLLPVDQYQFEPYFTLRTPVNIIHGEIISLLEGLTQIGTHHVVVINRGKHDNLRPGDVLSILRKSRLVMDPYRPRKLVSLPNLRVGEMMVFRVFNRVSFALVMNATDTIHLHDRVINPG